MCHFQTGFWTKEEKVARQNGGFQVGDVLLRALRKNTPSCPLSLPPWLLYYSDFNTLLRSGPVNSPAEDKVQDDKIKQMSGWGWVFVTHESAAIKELNHLFWIITLLSKGTAAACLRRNLICLSKNTDGDIPAQRNHGKRVTADRRRQLEMGLIDSHQLSLGLCLL